MACMQMDNSREEHQHRLAAIENMVEFYDVLRQASHVLTDDKYDRCDRAAMRFLLHQNALAVGNDILDEESETVSCDF